MDRLDDTGAAYSRVPVSDFYNACAGWRLKVVPSGRWPALADKHGREVADMSKRSSGGRSSQRKASTSPSGLLAV